MRMKKSNFTIKILNLHSSISYLVATVFSLISLQTFSHLNSIRTLLALLILLIFKPVHFVHAQQLNKPPLSVVQKVMLYYNGGAELT